MQLFERDRRRVLVTARGQALLDRARAVLLQADDLGDAAKRVADPFTGTLRIGETVEEVLKADLDLEHEAREQLRGAIAHCEQARDFVSRELFERILESEEEHIDFLETQFEMIKRMGLENYIQLQSKPAED